ncbi:hypothetical protein DSO57_1039021, partial [Entomophthora muscae]
QVDNQATAPSSDQPSDSFQALYCPPGAPFGPVHFTKYLPSPTYLVFNLENILIANLLARNRLTKYIGGEGKWYEVPPRLFKDNYKYLPAYFVRMTPLLTLQPDCPMKPFTATKTTSPQMFGLAPILWWALPTGPAVPRPDSPNASPYAWLPNSCDGLLPDWAYISDACSLWL